MAHYAYLTTNNIVTDVIVGKDENDPPGNWEAYYGAKERLIIREAVFIIYPIQMFQIQISLSPFAKITQA